MRQLVIGAMGLTLILPFGCRTPRPNGTGTEFQGRGRVGSSEAREICARLNPDGDIVPSSGSMCDGHQAGVWAYWRPDGSLLMVGSFDQDGNLDGPWLATDGSGKAVENVGGLYQCDGLKTTSGDEASGEWCRLWQNSLSSDQILTLPRLINGWAGLGFYYRGRYLGQLDAQYLDRALDSLVRQVQGFPTSESEMTR